MVFDYKTFFSDLYNNIVEHWQYSITVFCLLVAFITIKRFKKSLAPIKVSKSNYGSLSISRKALVKTIIHVALNLGLKIEPAVKIKNVKSKLYIELYIKLTSNQVFEKFSIALQESISNTFINELGVSKELEISIILAGIDKISDDNNDQGK